MVDIADLDKVKAALAERTFWQRAVQATAGKITGFELNSDQTGTVMVSAEGIDYPAQMMATIKTELEEHLAEAEEKLADLGVTGLDAQR